MNMNDTVRVQLTEAGKAALRKNAEKLSQGMNFRVPEHPYTEDRDGWSEWQLWVLMAEFGPHLHHGFGPCLFRHNEVRFKGDTVGAIKGLAGALRGFDGAVSDLRRSVSELSAAQG